MFLAIKEIKKEKGRFFLIISIFVLLSYLVYFLAGLAYGLAVDNKTAVDQWQGSHIVLASGSNNSISSSMIDQTQLEEDLEGLDYSLINLSRSAAYINGSELDKNTINIALIGMEEDSKTFPEILEGNPIVDNKDAIGSMALKTEEGLELGDELKLSMNGTVFTIVGFTDDYKYNVSPVIYTKLPESSAAAIIYKPAEEEENGAENDIESQGQIGEEIDSASGATAQVPERVSAAVLFLDQEDSQAVRDLNEKYDVITMDKFISEIPGYYAQLLTFGLMIGFLIVIAAIVLGVFLFIITIQKKETFGIMKIQGISNSYIAKSVIVQTFLVSVIGLAIGLALTYITEQVLPDSVPFRSNHLFYAIITIIMIITAQIGAIFSVRSVSSVDPLEVI